MATRIICIRRLAVSTGSIVRQPDHFSKIGQAAIGIFAFSTYISNIIQIPQRSVVTITIGLSEAWRENYGMIEKRVYKRSSINLRW